MHRGDEAALDAAAEQEAQLVARLEELQAQMEAATAAGQWNAQKYKLISSEAIRVPDCVFDSRVLCSQSCTSYFHTTSLVAK